MTNGGNIGMGQTSTSTTYVYTYSYNTGSYLSYIAVSYSGGTDADAPTSGFVPYDGVTSYKEGARTFFATFTDIGNMEKDTA